MRAHISPDIWLIQPNFSSSWESRYIDDFSRAISIRDDEPDVIDGHREIID